MRILLVGDYNRSDFLYIAQKFGNEIEFYFIEHLNKKKVTNQEVYKLGKVVFWKDYKDAYALIKKVQPHKVLFLFIETYNHVALNIACKLKKIPTYHLEHGLRFPVAYYKRVNTQNQINKEQNLLSKIKSLSEAYDKIKNRLFFTNTKKSSPTLEYNFLHDYYKTRSTNDIFNTFEKIKSPLRLPDTFISFSPLVFSYHKEVNNLHSSYPVIYTGVPAFDEFFSTTNSDISEEVILFVDQPLYEQGLFGWTLEYRINFLTELGKVAKTLKKVIYIKPHPWNEIKSYESLKNENVKVLQEITPDLIPKVNILLGFSSTLLLPFMAKQDVCCFIFQMNPLNDESQTSFFQELGPCHTVSSFRDLISKVKAKNDYLLIQQQRKKKFIDDWLYKFDGQSTERLKNILLSKHS